MSKQLIRVYKDIDPNQIKTNLLIYGDLGGSCSNCQNIDVKIDSIKCPQCQNEFHYYAFRNIKVHFPKILKLIHERPHVMIIDYEDYKQATGSLKAKEFFG